MADSQVEVKDGNATIIAMKSQLNSGKQSLHYVSSDETGTAFGVANPMTVRGLVSTPVSSFTRPADTNIYAVGDMVADSVGSPFSGGANSFTATRVPGGSFMIKRIRLRKSSPVLTNALFAIRLFSPAPTSLAGDNAVFSATGVASYLGGFDVLVNQAFSDGAFGAGIPITGTEVTAKLGSGVSLVYWLLEARGTYQPIASETFTIQPEIIQD